MKKILILIIVLSVAFSCNNKKKGNMIVKGKIEGLKKGSLFLQKFKDTLLITVDSVHLSGTDEFELTDNVESPEIYYLTLGEKEDEKISFFGEKGIITIHSKLNKLISSAEITGSKNQKFLEEYQEMIKQFNNKELDFFKAKFEAQRDNDQEMIIQLEKDEQNLLKRKYYYTTNFAVNHSKNEVAPYLALTELFYANIKLLDTINNSLNKKVKASKYGVQLEKFITNIKNNDQ